MNVSPGKAFSNVSFSTITDVIGTQSIGWCHKPVRTQFTWHNVELRLGWKIQHWLGALRSRTRFFFLKWFSINCLDSPQSHSGPKSHLRNCQPLFLMRWSFNIPEFFFADGNFLYSRFKYFILDWHFLKTSFRPSLKMYINIYLLLHQYLFSKSRLTIVNSIHCLVRIFEC